MLGVVGFLPFVRQCVSGGVHGHEHVSDSSTCFDVDVFSIIQYIGTSQLISEFLSEGLDLCVDVYLIILQTEGYLSCFQLSIAQMLSRTTDFILHK